MSYLDEALEVKKHFTTLLAAAIIKKSLNQYNIEDFYLYTGKIATIYGHAFLAKYDTRHLTTIFSINELIASLTYATFDLDQEKVALSEITLKHFKEVKEDLEKISDQEDYEEIPGVDRMIDIEIVKENLIHYLEDGNLNAYNKELKKIVEYGEMKHDRALKENEGFGDDDSENEDYEFALYESNKNAEEELENYYNLYNELQLDVTDYYDFDLMKKRIEEIR